VVVPPLRERGPDIVVLARRFVERIGIEMGRAGMQLSPEAEEALAAHPWPGNVRQLRNVLERAVLLSDHPLLRDVDLGRGLPVASAPEAKAPGTRMTLAEAERQHIEAVLRQERGHVPRSAEVLGLSRSALYERIKKHAIAVPRTTN
jgi:DNA-binding NtrC family response regulator